MKKEGVIIDFVVPPFLHSPLPRHAYDDLQHPFAPVICVPFILAGQFAQKGKMLAVLLDFNSKDSFVSSGLLPPKAETEEVEVDEHTVPFHFKYHTETQVNCAVPLVLRGRDAKVVASFPIVAYVITIDRVNHFPFQRIILGADFIQRYAVSMYGTTDGGEIYFEDNEGNIYAQSFQKKCLDKG